MPQQVKFHDLTQSTYDGLSSKAAGDLYFTSDTHRIYKGSTLIAADFSSDVELTPIYSQTPTFSEWNVVCSNPTVHGVVVYDSHERKYMLYDSDNPDWLFDETEAIWSEDSATSLQFSYVDGGLTFVATRTRTDFLGYQLGSQDDKLLATAAQGAKANTAIQGVKLDGSAVTPAADNTVNLVGLATQTFVNQQIQAAVGSAISASY